MHHTHAANIIHRVRHVTYIAARLVVLLSSEPRAANEKVDQLTILMNEADYLMRNFGDRGGCYPSRP